MHHDPRHFSDPDLFYPDRWTKEAKLHNPRFSYFPFGGGIRGCVGEPFAWMEEAKLHNPNLAIFHLVEVSEAV